VKTSAPQRPTITPAAAPTQPAAPRSNSSDAYRASLTDALTAAGLMRKSPGALGTMVLDGTSALKLLQHPDVKADVGRFVREALVGEKALHFVFGPNQAALVPFAHELGVRGEWDTLETMREALRQAFAGAGVQRLALDHALEDAYALGSAGTTAASGTSTFRAASATRAALPGSVQTAAPAAPASPLGQLLQGATFTSYEQPSDTGTLTLKTRRGEQATVTFTLSKEGDRIKSARFTEPGPIATSSQASAGDLTALLGWLSGAQVDHPMLTFMASRLGDQVSTRQ